MKISLALIFAGLLTGTAAAPAAAQPVEWSFDNTHLHVEYAVNHLGFSTSRGDFSDLQGTLMLDDANPANSSVSVTIGAASLDTRHEPRTRHLVGGDFFDVTNHPTITFVSSVVEPTGDHTASVSGDLTILGITKPVTLSVTLTGRGPNPFNPEVEVVGFQATTTILRSEFGMGFGVPAIGDEVEITIDLEATRS
jgi:polyisoprenoid-binding protein YceI